MARDAVYNDKVERIIDAAFRVFLEKGYHATRIEDVAELAQVGKGTIYLYYQGKQELFLATLQQTIGRMVSGLREKASGAGDFRDRLIRVTTEVLELSMAHPDFGGERMELPHSCKEECRALLIKSRNEVHQILADIFREARLAGTLTGADPDFAATAFLGMTQGIVIDCILLKRPCDCDSAAEALVGLFLEGALNPRTQLA